jgi:hypothetical protein
VVLTDVWYSVNSAPLFKLDKFKVGSIIGDVVSAFVVKAEVLNSFVTEVVNVGGVLVVNELVSIVEVVLTFSIPALVLLHYLKFHIHLFVVGVLCKGVALSIIEVLSV